VDLEQEEYVIEKIKTTEIKGASGTIFESPNASTKRLDASDSCRTPGAPSAPPAFRRHSASVRPRAGRRPDAAAPGRASITVSLPLLALLASDAPKVN